MSTMAQTEDSWKDSPRSAVSENGADSSDTENPPLSGAHDVSNSPVPPAPRTPIGNGRHPHLETSTPSPTASRLSETRIETSQVVKQPLTTLPNGGVVVPGSAPGAPGVVAFSHMPNQLLPTEDVEVFFKILDRPQAVSVPITADMEPDTSASLATLTNTPASAMSSPLTKTATYAGGVTSASGAIPLGTYQDLHGASYMTGSGSVYMPPGRSMPTLLQYSVPTQGITQSVGSGWTSQLESVYPSPTTNHSGVSVQRYSFPTSTTGNSPGPRGDTPGTTAYQSSLSRLTNGAGGYQPYLSGDMQSWTNFGSSVMPGMRQDAARSAGEF